MNNEDPFGTIAAAPPEFGEAEAIAVARERYGLDASARALVSERDQNFLLDSAEMGKVVLKIANGLEDRAMLEAQNEVMQHLARRGVTVCPQVLPTLDGKSTRWVLQAATSPGKRLCQSR